MGKAAVALEQARACLDCSQASCLSLAGMPEQAGLSNFPAGGPRPCLHIRRLFSMFMSTPKGASSASMLNGSCCQSSAGVEGCQQQLHASVGQPHTLANARRSHHTPGSVPGHASKRQQAGRAAAAHCYPADRSPTHASSAGRPSGTMSPRQGTGLH